MIYLASPYSHPDPDVREWRYQKVCRVTALLMVAGLNIFSPIAHTHPIAKYGSLDALDADFYLKYDKEMLGFAEGMYILMLDGWEQSYGIGEERKFANDKNIPVGYLDSITLELIPKEELGTQ